MECNIEFDDCDIFKVNHYTSADGLYGIFENRTLRFSNIDFLNDKYELWQGLNAIADIVNINTNEFEQLKTDEFEEHLFVCCFSLEEDSLPMWNYYTKESTCKGYNICFSLNELLVSFIERNEFLKNCDISYGRVEYINRNKSLYAESYVNNMKKQKSQELIKSAERILPDIELSELFKGILVEDLNTNDKNERIPVYVYDKLRMKFEHSSTGDFIGYVKNKWFEHEKEVRVIIKISTDELPTLKKKKIYRFRVQDGIMIPYIDLKFDISTVKNIIISPSINSDIVRHSLLNFLKYNDIDIGNDNSFIKHSNIPIRF